MAPLVPDTRPPTTESPETVHRTVRVRLYPGDAATGHRLAGTAGACRHVWNAILADYDLAYRMWRAFGKLGPGPGPPTFITFGQRFTELRNDPARAWLKDLLLCLRALHAEVSGRRLRPAL